MAGWTGFLNIVLRYITEQLGADNRETREQLLNIYKEICSTYALGHLSLSIAQHYGLPSHGLDVTKDYRIALSFALHEFFQSNTPGLMSTKRLKQGDEPVFYVFAMPEKKYFIDFADSASIFKTATRPEKQKATFIYSGWGERYNDSSRWLIAAFYPSDISRFDDILDAKEYFPGKQDDIFGAVLSDLSEQIQTSPQLRKYLERLYWVK